MGSSFSMTIDATGLANGIRASSVYSKRTMPEIVNTCMHWVAINATKTMPFVTPDKIDTELEVAKSRPPIGMHDKSGKLIFGKATYSAEKMITTADGREVPLAALIMSARANPDSRYNKKTDSRYALPAHFFKGYTRGLMHQKMEAFIHQMIAARHRSGGFLKAGWREVSKLSIKHALQKFSPGWGPIPEGGVSNRMLGQVHYAAEGFTCEASIENDVGTDSKHKNSENHNKALIRIGGPLLQNAVDVEGVKQMQYALRKANEELAQAVNKFWI